MPSVSKTPLSVEVSLKARAPFGGQWPLVIASVVAVACAGCPDAKDKPSEDRLTGEKAPAATNANAKALENAVKQDGTIKPVAPDGDKPQDDTNADDAVDSVYKAQSTRLCRPFCRHEIL